MTQVAEARQTSSAVNDGLQPVHVVAKFLALSRSKVYSLMESGQLPFVKLGKSRRVRWSDVIKLVENNLVSSDKA